MTQDVKSHPYHSPRRQAAARETRRLITATATRLFIERGYTATSMRDIAATAEVAEKTLYLTFGSKADLLRAVADQAIAGDDEPVPVAERRWFKDILAASDSRQLLQEWAGHQEQVFRRLSDLIETVRAAANSDPEIAALYREKRDELITDVRHIATALAARGDLREDLTVTEAADHLNAITGPELHRVLVIDRGWTPERYRAWTRRNLENYLLKPPT
jgi:AcrR family transcriptional regulator